MTATIAADDLPGTPSLSVIVAAIVHRFEDRNMYRATTMKSTRIIKRTLLGLAVWALTAGAAATASGEVGKPEHVLSVLDVAPVWSVHRPGSPVLLTRGEYQYVLYYDGDRHVALAQRRLDSDTWSYHTFPEVLGWASGAHCNLSMAIDEKGFIHVSAYNRGFAKAPPGPIYYRSGKPHDISAWTKPDITSVPVPCYPTFVQTADNKLMYKFRQGSAVKGDNLWTVYDQEAGKWQPCRVLTAGIDYNRYAYNTMVPGPDGYVHAAYVWADASSPCNFNTVSHIRSRDLENWETIAGEPLAIPLTYDTKGVVVCPVPHNSGMLNNPRTGFDSRKRPVITYQRFDPNGNTQFYNARYENGAWHNVAATAWDYRWRWVASGEPELDISPVQPAGDGKLVQKFKHIKYGDGFIVLDETTLKPRGGTHEYTLSPSSALELTRTVTASSELPGFEAARATDGDKKTRWLPEEQDEQPWLELDFGREITFEHCSMQQLRLDVLAFAVDYWDGAQWQQAYQSTKMQSTFHNETWMYSIRPVTTRKVRLRLTSVNRTRTPVHKPNDILQASIFEFDVHVKRPNPDFSKPDLERMTPWPRELEQQESTFALRPMTVEWIADAGSTQEAGASYYLRWEHGPSNRDAEVPKPWPAPTMLRVYKLKTINPDS